VGNDFLALHNIRNSGYLNSIWEDLNDYLEILNLKMIGGRKTWTIIESKEQFNFAKENGLVIHISVKKKKIIFIFFFFFNLCFRQDPQFKHNK
jgi:hypothetical protein